MNAGFTENHVEEAALSWLEDLAMPFCMALTSRRTAGLRSVPATAM